METPAPRLHTPSYPLVISASAILIFSAQNLLLAPYNASAHFSDLPAWVTSALGAALYILGVFLSGAALLNEDDSIYRLNQTLAGVALGLLALLYLQANDRVEALVLIAMGIGCIFSAHFGQVTRDWISLLALPLHFGLGLAFLLVPEQLNPPFALPAERIQSVAFGAAYLLSMLIAGLAIFVPRFHNLARIRLLAIPWLLWSGVFLSDHHYSNLIVLAGFSLGLALNGLLPWGRLILMEGRGFGKRFFYLIAIGQVISFSLIAWMMQVVESYNAIPAKEIITLQQIALVTYNLTGIVAIVIILSINLSINGLFAGLNGEQSTQILSADQPFALKSLARIVMQPFHFSRDLLSAQVQRQQAVENLLNQQIATEKRRTAQLHLLRQLNLDLEPVYEPSVSSQLAANTIYHALGGELVAIFRYDPERRELSPMAVSGPQAWTVPAGYRQSADAGLLGRAVRSRRLQLVSDTSFDPEHIRLQGQTQRSEIAVPMIYRNLVRGVFVVTHADPNAFDDSDIRTLETVALRLVTAWTRSEHDQHMTELIEAGVTLLTLLDVQKTLEEIASITHKTLEARFVFVALADKGGGFTRVASQGNAPTLFSILNSDPIGNSLIQQVMNSPGVVRMRDFRKKHASIPTGNAELRNLIGIPLRIRQSSVGAIIAFGKQGYPAFSEEDEGLASLLANQAGAAVETSWLYQELRSMLKNATLLYQLSARVIQAEQLTDAAAAIAETVHQVSNTYAAGITLFSTQTREIETRVQIDANGLQPGNQHPMILIEQTLQSGQDIFLSNGSRRGIACVPLQTPRRQYGALWLDIDEELWENSSFTDNLHTLANQAAIALERSLLLVETRQQAEKLQEAFAQLEATYDQTLQALSAALDARDRETEGHSRRVSEISLIIAKHIGFSPEQLKTLLRGSILHDIGKIGISDTILLKPGKLTDAEWIVMRQHPDIGARIIEKIPFLQDTLPIIRYHQERWDGSGYPIGLKGEEIPLTARIFSIVDAFDALTSKRPYRQQISHEEAIEYLNSQAGILFDPNLVSLFERLYQQGALREALPSHG